MFRPNNALAALLLAALCGCAHVADTRSLAHRQAMAWAAQGEKAYVAGDLDRSRRCYEQALRINTSIENAHGIASDMLSLGQIHLESGEYESARSMLQPLLEDRNRLFASGDKAGAAARLAQLALLQKQPDKAVQLAQQAEALCRESDCGLAASILNLRAQGDLAAGRLDEAMDGARRAEGVADKQPAELANSHRLRGLILLRRQSAMEAVQQFEQALVLDKQLGLAGKIAEDLQGQAEAREALGQRGEAELLRERERAVRKASGMRGDDPAEKP